MKKRVHVVIGASNLQGDLISFTSSKSYPSMLPRRFIKYFIKVASHLFGLLAKDSKFSWSKSYQEALETLKDKFTTAPIL